MNTLQPNFFQVPSLILAARLLNTELVRVESDGTETSGRIVEVEAYSGPEDQAAHSYGNRRTARTEVMFGPAGRAYVYRIYGMHHCLNVVASIEGKPEAVLIRALEPTNGLERMESRRNTSSKAKEKKRFKPHELTNGPGKLCEALHITMSDYGIDLTEPPLYLRLVPREARVSSVDLVCGPRINIDYAGAWKNKPWRIWIYDNSYVSRPHRPITSFGKDVAWLDDALSVTLES